MYLLTLLRLREGYITSSYRCQLDVEAMRARRTLRSVCLEPPQALVAIRSGSASGEEVPMSSGARRISVVYVPAVVEAARSLM